MSFENKIMEIVDIRDEVTRGDLQGMITMIVNQIMDYAERN